MTKTLAGMLAVLVAALGLMGWLLYRQIGLTEKQREAAEDWKIAAEVADEDAKAAVKREGSPNSAMKALVTKKLESDLLAQQRESELNNLKQTEGDTNETISCLDQRVPAELTRLLNAK